MERVSFLYPSNCQELGKFTSDASADSLADMEKIIDKSEADRKVAQSFAKLAAILQDLSLVC